MSTNKYANFISNEIERGVYEGKKEAISLTFHSSSDVDKFVDDASKMGIKNIIVNMKNVKINCDNDDVFKIIPLIDKYDGFIF